MNRIGSAVAGIVLGFSTFAAPAQAQTSAAELVQGYLARESIGPAEEKLLELAARGTGSADARLGLGLVRSARAFERLSQQLYRHGFLSGAQEVGSMVVGVGGSIAYNPNPEPITYQQFRGILQAFVDDLAAAEAVLAEVGDAPAKVRVDLARTKFDWNGDGVIGPEDHFGTMVADLDASGQPKPFVVGFDTADARWLRGYCNLLMAVAKFWLAHDFSESWDSGFGVVFPRAQTSIAMADGGSPEAETMFSVQKKHADSIADFITIVHTIRWPIADKAMWQDVRGHLRKVASLNRETWALVRAETDDDHEWLPSPKQKSGVLPSLPVTEERITAWLAVLSQVEGILDGKILVPHWRFAKGVNVAKVFDEPKAFDLVLWVTGPGALPYLADGPVMNEGDWNSLTRIFQGNFASYAFYFN